MEFLQDDATVGMGVAEQGTDSVSEIPDASEGDNIGEESEESMDAKGTMLLVEDNSELRLFLRSIFASEYRIVEAVDGMQGWGKALKFLPDIIISDVMMPGKDGITMTRELRADMTTSHIPIVLLTALRNFISNTPDTAFPYLEEKAPVKKSEFFNTWLLKDESIPPPKEVMSAK